MARDDGRTVVVGDPAALGALGTRRSFLRALGMGGSIVLLPSVFAACEDSTDSVVSPGVAGQYDAQQAITIPLNDDVGIFNFAFLLEQLDSKYYETVNSLPNLNTVFPDAGDREVLADLRGDEVVHREFYRAALTGAGGLLVPDVQPDFSRVNFNDRAAILETARALEDTGIAAYNGAGRFLRRLPNLLTAGKIVSMEARHSAAIRDMIAGNAGDRFANVSDLADLGANEAQGLDAAAVPSTPAFQRVLANAQPFIPQQINLTSVPSAS
jgi:hypothetical protein